VIVEEPTLAAPQIPFRGIQPFRYADHAIFFARETETRLLASLVAVHRGVFLYGASGNGKSSLVNAGLLPQARDLGFEPLRVRVQPRGGEELVVDHLGTGEGDERQPLAPAAEHDGSTRTVFSIADFEERVRAGSGEHRTLVVFDQFEEILTLFADAQAAESRRALVAMIGRLLRDPIPVKLLFAFREDYLGSVKQLLDEHPELVDQALRLGPLDAADLGTIIRGPFERFPGHFERELDQALADRLGAELGARFGSGAVSLSEVQTVCLRLWRASDPEHLLTTRGVQGLLEDELGEALGAFSEDLRAAATAVLSQMVTAAGTRNVVSAEDLRLRVHDEDAQIVLGLVDEALQRLESEARLVRRERRRDIDLFEITSEFLVPWISERREEARMLRQRSRDEALAGIAAAGYRTVELTAVEGWTEHVDLDADTAELRRRLADRGVDIDVATFLDDRAGVHIRPLRSDLLETTFAERNLRCPRPSSRPWSCPSGRWPRRPPPSSTSAPSGSTARPSAPSTPRTW